MTNLPMFGIDAFEVTASRFRAFLDGALRKGWKPGAGAGAWHDAASTGWSEAWNSAIPSDDSAVDAWIAACAGTIGNATEADMPANCVDWPMAFAFCIWEGGRLPTEAEWEAAASGMTEGLFPWGNEAPHDYQLGQTCDADAGVCTPAQLRGAGTTNGNYSLFDVYDAAGNVAEWVLDWFDPGWYATVSCAAGPNVIPPLGNETGTRSLRGGSYETTHVAWVRAAARDHALPSAREARIGFRCAYEPATAIVVPDAGPEL